VAKPATNDDSAEEMSSEEPTPKRVYLMRSEAWAVAPGGACRGALELTPTTLMFEPWVDRWGLIGFGGRRDLQIPRPYILSARQSSLLESLGRYWVRRLLIVKLVSGRQLAFGVPRISDWVDLLAAGRTASESSETATERQLSHISRDLWIDVAAMAGAAAASMALVSVSLAASVAALVGYFAIRCMVRARACRRT
jgi:hypothetical protein